jgi:acetoacetyl-CoA synthetase
MNPADVLWTPSADALDRSRVGQFMAWLRANRGLDFTRYDQLWHWSVDELAAFWGAVWEYFDVLADGEASPVLPDAAMPGARWFPAARLNYAENVLRMPGIADDEPAVLAYSQTRPPVILTAAELRDEVRRVRAGLRRLGIGPGDRVAAYSPNIPETFVLMLAAASLGAIFTSCAPEFGTRSVVDRWQQIEPVLLVAVDGYRYGDKAMDRSAEVAEIRAALPSLRHVVSLSYLDPGRPLPDGATAWSELATETDEPLEFDRLPFDHPLYVLYSSGTTGLPKPIVHGHGGILLEHLKNLALQKNLGPGDRFFWFSTTGWMMWNFLVAGPAVGAAVVMFDGNPGAPDLGETWRLVQTARITYFGTSAPFLLACRKAGIVPKDLADLSTLVGVGSTGAPLPPEGFRWVYEAVTGTAQLHSISGGTDVCTGFVGASPLLPVIAGEISCRCLGAKVEAFDPTGKPVIGQVGELVITEPMPSMPVGFWNDPDGAKYRAAYFEKYPNIWRHGDWCEETEHGGFIIYGRSDAVLNPGGVRIGTAEIYRQVESLAEVVESLVIGQEWQGDVRVVLFVKLKEGLSLSPDLVSVIKSRIRENTTPRHVPAKILQVTDIPRTKSGKIVELAVRDVVHGRPVKNLEALANPEALENFRGRSELAAP